MPHCLVEKMDMKSSLFPAARRDFSQDQLDQIRKTARVVSQEPWRLFEAQDWLEKLCDANERHIVKEPPALEMVLEIGTCGNPGELPDFSDLVVPDDPPPRVVRVAAKRAMKRPASSMAVPVLRRPAAHEPAQRALKRPAAAREHGPAGGGPGPHDAEPSDAAPEPAAPPGPEPPDVDPPGPAFCLRFERSIFFPSALCGS